MSERAKRLVALLVSGIFSALLVGCSNGGGTSENSSGNAEDSTAFHRNAAPTSNAGPDQTVNAGTTVTLFGSGADPDGYIAGYTWTQLQGPAVTLNNATGATASFTAPSVTVDTLLTFRLTVRDNRGATNADTINVTVRAPVMANQPPIATAGAAQSVTSGIVVTLSGSGVDPENGALKYRWSQTAGPAVTLNNATAASASFTAPAVAVDTTLTFQLVVADDQGATGNASTNITVRPAPTPTTGWTDIPALSGSARIIYVSASSGNDTNTGLTTDQPLQTIPAGYGKLRDNVGDRLLLKRGDVFPLNGLTWNISGESASRPTVFGAYGSGPRPVVQTTGQIQIARYQATQAIQHIIITDLDFIDARRVPGASNPPPKGGAAIMIGGSPGVTAPFQIDDILIEGVRMQWYQAGITITAMDEAHPNRNIRIRRNVIANLYCTTYQDSGNCGNGDPATGIYAGVTQDLLVEENIFDNFFLRGVPGVDIGIGAGGSQFSHGIYIQNNDTNAIVRGNIFSRVPDGTMMRGSGKYTNNLIVRAGIGTMQGRVWGTPPFPGGIPVDVTHNVFVEMTDGQDPSGDYRRGWGMYLGNIGSGSVSDNLIANSISLASDGGVGITLDGGTDGGNVGVANLTVTGNVVYNAGTAFAIRPGSHSNNVIQSNAWQANTSLHPLAAINANLVPFTFLTNNWYELGSAWFSVNGSTQSFMTWHASYASDTGQQKIFFDPTRSVGSYHGTLDPANPTLEAFMTQAHEQSRDNWRPAYTASPVINYLRAGFGMP